MKNRLIDIADSYRYIKKHSIGRRFAIYILAFSSVFTLISTAFQLSIEYNKDVNKIDSRFVQIYDSYYQSLTRSLWTTSKKDLEFQLEGIIKLPDMQYIEVLSDEGELLAFKGIKKTKHIISHAYPLKYMYHGKELILGKIHMIATLDGVYERLKDRVLVILLTQGIKTFVVSLFILYLFQVLVGRHLVSISQFLNLEEKELDEKLDLDRVKSKYTKNDELEQTVDAINKMRKSLYLSYDKLMKSEKNLNKAQEISNLGSWQFNNSTGELQCSAEVYHIYGLEPFSKIIDVDWFYAHLHSSDIAMINEAIKEALDGENDYDVKHSILTVDGNERVVHHKAEVYFVNNTQMMSGTIQDITESYHTLEEVSRLSQVVNQNPFSTIITDENGIIQFTNMQTVIMTGYAEQELIGKKMNIFSSDTHKREFFIDLWNTILVDKTTWRGTIINKMKNGENIDCLSVIFPIFNDNNEITNFVTIQEDVTKQNIKDKLFMVQTRQAQMGEMISVIAHQWRQPLSSIAIAVTSVQLKKELGTCSDDFIDNQLINISYYTKHLSQTIDDFRNFYKPDKEYTTIGLEEVISKSLRIIESSLKSENIKIIKEYNSHKKLKLYDNEIVQVLLNIFKNAQDNFTEKKIENPEITIKVTDNTILISDNGGGIKENILDNIFEPYFSTKNEMNGTGLGLYMSKLIVEKHHNGTLSVENIDGGVCFKISL